MNGSLEQAQTEQDTIKKSEFLMAFTAHFLKLSI